jgi:competence protein ComEC
MLASGPLLLYILECVDFIKKYRSLAVLCLLAVICVAIWAAVYAAQGRHSGVLTFAVLDIGQGDGLFIEGPTGIQVLVDAGPNTGAVLSQLPKVMAFGDRTLDAVIETHPDADHMGGFVDVLERYKVGAFITPGIIKHNTTTDALDREVDDQHIPIYIARRGMVVDLGGGAELDVLYPDQDVTNFGEKTNDGAVVAHLVYGSTSAMLTADAPFSTEAHLIQISTSTDLASDLLKVGHHGSKTSTSDAFIAAVHPQTALISVGADNTYGHPTQETLSRLASAGVPVIRTDQKGTVTCRSDGAKFTCTTEK